MASDSSYGNNGCFIIPKEMTPHNNELHIIASDGMDWDHVSVSTQKRCPNWDEMCFVKNLFWSEDEVVFQFHPSKDSYVNNHRFCLHLWKPQRGEITLPPEELIGKKSAGVLF